MKIKKIACYLLFVAMLFALGGCNPGEKAGSDGLKICIVTNAGVDDGNFNEDVYNGILSFIDKNPDCTVNHVKEPEINQLMNAVSDVIADYDVLVLPGYFFAPVGAIAAENPDKRIILVDTEPTDSAGNPVEAENIYSMTFAEQEGGFFAGVSAALESKSNKVAIVTGIAYPAVVNYQWGFESGVNYANEHFGTDVEVVELPSYAGVDVNGNDVGGNYVGSFDDQATAKTIANTLIDQGVDIIFIAAGNAGNGVFTAVKEADGVFAIGCDVDQYDDGARGSDNIILTSTLKVMHINVERQLKAIQEGTFEGENALLHTNTDSIGFVRKAGRHQMSDGTVSKLDEAYELVKKGTVVPPSSFNGYSPEDFPGLK